MRSCLGTDGTKDNGKRVCSAIFNQTIVRKALPKESCIFTAKACATDQVLNIISESNCKNLYSETRNVLLSLKNKKLEDLLIIKLLSRVVSMSNSKEILICCIPSHIGVRGKIS